MELVIDPQKAIGIHVSFLKTVPGQILRRGFLHYALPSQSLGNIRDMVMEIVSVKFPVMEMYTEYFLTLFFFNPSWNWTL